MRISDWSSDVCSSDLNDVLLRCAVPHRLVEYGDRRQRIVEPRHRIRERHGPPPFLREPATVAVHHDPGGGDAVVLRRGQIGRAWGRDTMWSAVYICGVAVTLKK